MSQHNLNHDSPDHKPDDGEFEDNGQDHEPPEENDSAGNDQDDPPMRQLPLPLWYFD